jgi:hypothetical protein
MYFYKKVPILFPIQPAVPVEDSIKAISNQGNPSRSIPPAPPHRRPPPRRLPPSTPPPTLKTASAMKSAATMRSRAMKTADAELLEIPEIGGRLVTSPTAGAESGPMTRSRRPLQARRPDPAVLCKPDDQICSIFCLSARSCRGLGACL